jgi:hypothetical protein
VEKLMKTIMTVILPDGTTTDEELNLPREVPLDTFYKLAEPHGIPRGYVEHVTVFHNKKYTDMFVHEEGRLKGLPYNPKATEIYHANAIAHQGQTKQKLIAQGFFIVGPALLFDRKVWY